MSWSAGLRKRSLDPQLSSPNSKDEAEVAADTIY